MTEPYWLEEPSPRLRSSRVAGRADVAVVGGGVTGCACALALAEGGLRVRLHEARRIAGGASGRNGGFALRGGAMAYDVARARLGGEPARELWQLSERALDRLAALAGDAFRREGSIRLAADEEERTALAAEHAALVADGFAAEWVERPEPPLGSIFAAGLVHPRDGALQPARWVRRLAALAAAAGAELRERELVTSLDDLDADAVVIATDGYTRGLLPALDRAIRPTRGQVLVTEPLERRLFSRPHYARRGYDYWQQTPGGRLVIGGWRDADLEREWTAEEATTPAIQARIEAFAERLTGRPPVVTHRWAGIFGSTGDGLPLAGPVPGRDGVWVAAGYSGHGNVLGLACGELVAGALLGRAEPPPNLFDPARVLELDPGHAP